MIMAQQRNFNHIIDMIGGTYGFLTVLQYAGKSANNSYKFKCRCWCGKETVVYGCHLKSGATKSCGCLAKISEKHKGRGKHNMYKSDTYGSWSAMKERCTRTGHPAYHRYGGRGITYCNEWESFANFYRDMGKRPQGKCLDRIDNNLGYSKENCRWATNEEQGSNRNNNHTVTYKGQSRTISQWSRELGLGKTTIRERLNRGWSDKESLSLAKGKRGRNAGE
jgi:hypothetical protein